MDPRPFVEHQDAVLGHRDHRTPQRLHTLGCVDPFCRQPEPIRVDKVASPSGVDADLGAGISVGKVPGAAGVVEMDMSDHHGRDIVHSNRLESGHKMGEDV